MWMKAIRDFLREDEVDLGENEVVDGADDGG